LICTVEEINNKTRYRAIIREDYFHIIGHTFFIFPFYNEKDLDEKIQVKFEWKNFPTNYNFANSFGTQQQEQTTYASIREIKHSIYVGGDFRIHQFTCENNPIFVAIRGEHDFDDAQLIELAQKIIPSQRNFWNDHNFPYFLITTIPMDAKHSIGGSGLENAFSIFLGKTYNIMQKLTYLLSHEHFHTWNGRKIKREEPERLVCWFSEGFTDYYAALLNLRSGLISFEEYIENYNFCLYKYFTSKAKNRPNTEILEKYWQDEEINKLPYQRGQILAHNWNVLFQKESNGKCSIDNVMFDILEQAQTNNRLFSAKLFIEIMQKYLPQSIAPDIEKYIDNGETIIPLENAFGDQCTLEWHKTGEIELGFDAEKSIDIDKVNEAAKTGQELELGKIHVVNKDSNAYKAGLRDGQTILNISKSLYRNPIYPITLKIRDLDGTVKEISYIPVKKQEINVPQYRLA